MHQVNLSQTFTDGNNKVIELEEFDIERFKKDYPQLFEQYFNRHGGQLTLKNVAIRALLNETQLSMTQENAEKKLNRQALAFKIRDGVDLVDLKDTESVLLKEKINETYGALIVGQSYQMLDAKPSEAKTETV